MTIIPELNMTIKRMAHFSHLHFELYPLVYFIFAFQDLQNSISGVPILHYVSVCKAHIYMPKMTANNILFLHKNC